MQAYYGGRAEARVRHTSVPVIYTDFTSQYPTVNTLLRLWRVLTAERLRIVNATGEISALLQSVTLKDLFRPRAWSQLTFFALVQPDGDVLPVRADYGAGEMS